MRWTGRIQGVSLHACWIHTLLLLRLTATLPTAHAFCTVRDCSRQSNRLASSNLNDNNSNEAMEALQSLSEFHQGMWKGKTRSFSVTPDVAAGIVQRRESPVYTSSVQFQMDLKQRDFTLTETLEWQSTDKEGASSSSSRTISLGASNMDVDSVDASYSLDSTLPTFPSALMGTDKSPQFLVEHCIATSQNHRARCLAFYGVDDNLMRVVICDEERMPETETTNNASETNTAAAPWTARDLVELQSDVDRIVDKITGGPKEPPKTIEVIPTEEESTPLERLQESTAALNNNNDNEDGSKLVPHPMSLLELSSGVWLGDAIIRDVPSIAVSPLQKGAGGKGFGADSRREAPVSSTGGKERVPFASWSVGVQKVARRWMWNFGTEIRQVNDFGKAMGAEMAEALTRDLAGSVCVNEGLSRRLRPEERMAYIDWNEDNVGFLLGSYSIQVSIQSQMVYSRLMFRIIKRVAQLTVTLLFILSCHGICISTERVS